jgi:hypothetical protein
VILALRPPNGAVLIEIAMSLASVRLTGGTPDFRGNQSGSRPAFRGDEVPVLGAWAAVK